MYPKPYCCTSKLISRTLRKETLDLSNLLGNIPVDMTQRVHALFKKRFEEMEENESVVKIGRTLKDFQNQRIAIYNDGRSKFHSHIATLRQELSSNPTEKRNETVDRVLDRISETRKSVDQFSADLSDYDNQLAD